MTSNLFFSCLLSPMPLWDFECFATLRQSEYRSMSTEAPWALHPQKFLKVTVTGRSRSEFRQEIYGLSCASCFTASWVSAMSPLRHEAHRFQIRYLAQLEVAVNQQLIRLVPRFVVRAYLSSGLRNLLLSHCHCRNQHWNLTRFRSGSSLEAMVYVR